MFTVTIRDILAKLITVARNKIVIKLNKYSFKEFNLQSCVIPVFDKIILKLETESIDFIDLLEEPSK